jgi:hypothetical protein
MNKKQKFIVVLMLCIATVLLCLGCYFLLNEKETIDNTQDILCYQDALHNVAMTGQFSTNNSALMNELNKYLDDEHKVSFQDGVLHCTTKDDYNRTLVLQLVSSNMVTIISRGKDGKVNTNDDTTIDVIINANNAGFEIFTHQRTGCVHAYEELNVLSLTSCSKEGISKTFCKLCGDLKTIVEYKKDHNFETQNLTCGSVVTCTICQTTQDMNIEHEFTATNAKMEYLAFEGNCILQDKYYYSCVKCGTIGKETFDGGHNNKKHSDTKIVTISINESTDLQKLVCSGCGKDIITAIVEHYFGNADSEQHNVNISTEYDITYSTQANNDFSNDIPTFANNGHHITYYRITNGDYTLNGTASVVLNDIPMISIENLISTSPTEPYYVDDTKVLLTGYVHDLNGIKTFTINNTPVSIENSGWWSYELEISKHFTHDVRFYLEDFIGASSEIVHYISYNYINLMPDITINTPGNTETLHVNTTDVVLTGTVTDDKAIKSLIINGENVTVNNGTWTHNVKVEENTFTTFTIVACDIDDNIVETKVNVCHSNHSPMIYFTDFDGLIINGTVFDTNLRKCSEIKSITITTNILDAVVFHAPVQNITLNDQYTVAYLSCNEPYKEIDFEFVLFIDNIDYCEVIIETTHGEKILYKFTVYELDDGTYTVHIERQDLVHGGSEFFTLQAD